MTISVEIVRGKDGLDDKLLEVIVYQQSGLNGIPDSVRAKETLKQNDGFIGHVYDAGPGKGGFYILVREIDAVENGA